VSASSETVISVRGLTKAYRIWETPTARLTAPLFENTANLLPPGSNIAAWLRQRASSHYRDFRALDGISFDLKKGESIGIVGRNGSGKSTLLQLIAGTLQPTAGSLSVRGRVAALLELGSGFNLDFTGRENVHLYAAVLGLSRAEVSERFDEIVSFADIGDFLDQPVKTYSSGMMMRLAFAVNTCVDPDILIVDEALSVGDSYFQAKCMLRMHRMLERGLSLLFVTHSVDLVPQLCHHALYLGSGKQVAYGPAIDVVDHYLRDVRASQYRSGLVTASGDSSSSLPAPDENSDYKVDSGFTERTRKYRYGTGGARLEAVELLDVSGKPAGAFRFREKITVRAHLVAHKTIEALNCCVLVRNQQGLEILHATSREYGHQFVPLQRGERFIVDIKFENVLKPGTGYSIHYTINNTPDLQQQEILDLVELAAVFDVLLDPAHPIYYLVWQPFEFKGKLAGPSS
jgi:lipopolysaccharide transport system ATP-binding protein